jgi:hypothetical protein
VTRLSSLADRELRWVKAERASGGGYQLRDGDDVVATLGFRSSWGTLATATSADGCWTFKRVGFLQTRVTIRACDSEEEIAVFKNNSWTGGGTLELPDGRRIDADTNCWMTTFAFTTETGEPLVRFRKIGGLLSLSSAVEITPAGAAFAKAPWLVMLGWYVAVQMHDDAAVASSPGAAST